MRLNPVRRSSQAVFLALFIYLFLSPYKTLLPADIFFKTDPLLAILTSISARIALPGITLSFIMLILTLIFGRFFCGWVCPLGTTLELIGRLNRKRASREISAEKKPRRIKFFILAAIIIFALLGIQIVWFFDPMTIAARLIRLEPFFGRDARYFSYSAVVSVSSAAICVTAFFAKRFWCRALCPLGALYALIARLSKFVRPDIKEGSVINGKAIYRGGIARRDFIFLIFSSLFLPSFRNRKNTFAAARRVIRPPGALEESDFVDRCIRCGGCIRSCVTNGLQPAMLESGLDGIWTPHLVPEIGYCGYNCALCGNVCPTGAIPRLPLKEKQNAKMGLAEIDHSSCLVWSKNQQCLICEKNCPVPGKAIKIKKYPARDQIALKPVVDKTLCVGCGICQNKCPCRPVRAIRVSPS